MTEPSNSTLSQAERQFNWLLSLLKAHGQVQEKRIVVTYSSEEIIKGYCSGNSIRQQSVALLEHIKECHDGSGLSSLSEMAWEEQSSSM